MATEVKAWKAEDGTLHDSECEAATRDVEMLVERSPLAENSPYAKKLVEWLTENAGEIRTKLQAHERACPKVEAEAKQAGTLPTIEDRITAAIGQMQRIGDTAKDWLTRNGFVNLHDFVDRATEEQITDWEHFKDEPAAFGNGSKTDGR
jgi:hypothetical protein